MIQRQEPMNILFTSVGRRVALIRHFKKTLLDLGLRGRIVGVDFSEDAPAFHAVDKAYKICRIDDPLYISTLIDICKRESIHLLFPLIDTDLMSLAESRQAFAAAGTTAVISDPPVIEISLDKYKTRDFFAASGIDTPEVFDIEAILAGPAEYPLFMKPLDGNASKGIVKIRDERDLRFFKDYVANPILQEYVHGAEVTLDILFDFKGAVRCVVPRKRIEVRAGEVSKAVIIDNKKVVNAGWHLGSLLKGARGCINAQCFLTPDDKIKFVEINPRFGGGAPLSLHAGADFPKWIIEMYCGKDPGDVRDAYRKNIYMLRYDDAVFLDSLTPGTFRSTE